MNKEEFNKLTVEDQIQYFNSKFKTNETIMSISKILGIPDSTLRSRFRKAGYKLNVDKNHYDNDMTIASVEGAKDMTNLIQMDCDNDNIFVISENLKGNIIQLAEQFPVLQEMIEWYENNNDKDNTVVTEVVLAGITIDLPESEDYRTTIRINKEVWNKFDRLCSENEHLKRQDLYSQALLEFVNKYSKH